MQDIKVVLEIELENSRRQESAYRKALRELPAGVLVKKEIRGHHAFCLYGYCQVRNIGEHNGTN